jgi:2-polyprenyl-3-methyl-5-hydroxy-6-metoxy-1,4-benzoquinol methylase
MLDENRLSFPEQPELTGERVDPGAYPPGETLQQHAARYVFAARYCKGSQVLDVASGLGYGTDYLRTQGAKAVGLEINEQAVQWSRQRYPLSTYAQGSAERMPSDWSEAYDVVVSFETIEHLERPDDFLQEVFRCLRPGGLFLCSTPNKSLYLFEGHNRFHTKEFYCGEFLKFIGTRFRVREVFGQSFHPRGQVAFQAFRALGRKVLRVFHVPRPTGSPAVSSSSLISPFEGNSIVESRVLPEFMPAPVQRHIVPTFLVVLAEKSRG